MTKVFLTVDGLKEAIAAFDKTKQDIPRELEASLTASVDDMAIEFGQYPPQPQPKNPKWKYDRGSGMRYVPTGKLYATSEVYGKSISTHVARDGGDIEAFLNQNATYSLYLRGDLAGEGQAWMHKGVWPTTKEIVDRRLPQIEARLERAIADYIARSNL